MICFRIFPYSTQHPTHFNRVFGLDVSEKWCPQDFHPDFKSVSTIEVNYFWRSAGYWTRCWSVKGIFFHTVQSSPVRHWWLKSFEVGCGNFEEFCRWNPRYPEAILVLSYSRHPDPPLCQLQPGNQHTEFYRYVFGHAQHKSRRSPVGCHQYQRRPMSVRMLVHIFILWKDFCSSFPTASSSTFPTKSSLRVLWPWPNEQAVWRKQKESLLDWRSFRHQDGLYILYSWHEYVLTSGGNEKKMIFVFTWNSFRSWGIQCERIQTSKKRLVCVSKHATFSGIAIYSDSFRNLYGYLRFIRIYSQGRKRQRTSQTDTYAIAASICIHSDTRSTLHFRERNQNL